MKFFGAEHNVFTCEFQISHGTNRDWRRARVLEQANFSGSAGVYTYLAHFIMQWSAFNPVPTGGLVLFEPTLSYPDALSPIHANRPIRSNESCELWPVTLMLVVKNVRNCKGHYGLPRV
jgi:hypothetical protein